MSDLTSPQDILAVLSLATAMMDVPIGNLVIRLGAVSKCSDTVQCCLSSVGELNGAMMLIPTEFWWIVIVSVWSEREAAAVVVVTVDLPTRRTVDVFRFALLPPFLKCFLWPLLLRCFILLLHVCLLCAPLHALQS